MLSCLRKSSEKRTRVKHPDGTLCQMPVSSERVHGGNHESERDTEQCQADTVTLEGCDVLNPLISKNQSQPEKQPERPYPRTAERVSAIATIVIAGATVIYACYAHKQWGVMQQT